MARTPGRWTTVAPAASLHWNCNAASARPKNSSEGKTEIPSIDAAILSTNWDEGQAHSAPEKGGESLKHCWIQDGQECDEVSQVYWYRRYFYGVEYSPAVSSC